MSLISLKRAVPMDSSQTLGQRSAFYRLVDFFFEEFPKLLDRTRPPQLRNCRGGTGGHSVKRNYSGIFAQGHATNQAMDTDDSILTCEEPDGYIAIKMVTHANHQNEEFEKSDEPDIPTTILTSSQSDSFYLGFEIDHTGGWIPPPSLHRSMALSSGSIDADAEMINNFMRIFYAHAPIFRNITVGDVNDEHLCPRLLDRPDGKELVETLLKMIRKHKLDNSKAEMDETKHYNTPMDRSWS